MRRRIERKGRGMKILVIVTLVLCSAFISIDFVKALTKKKGTDSPKKCEDRQEEEKR